MPTRKLYEVIAAEIDESIRKGVLRAGDRLPSVRHLSGSRGVSPSTVFQAYYLLEGRGLLRARERSGYFVAPCGGKQPPQAVARSEPSGESMDLDVSDMIFRILDANPRNDRAGLGSAFPSPLLFPQDRLGQVLAASARTLDPWSSVDDLSTGNLALRRQIARRYMADGMTVSADEIVITNGALEAINVCLAAVARPGEAVILECPCFHAALQTLERMAIRAIHVPTHPGDGIDLGALEQAIVRNKPKACLLMSTFQNPLGSVMPERQKQLLAQLLQTHELPLIEDDVYGELHFTDRRPPAIKAFDTQGLVLHCSSFSKWLAPWYRIGWTVPGRFQDAVVRQKLTLNLSTCGPTQLALASYLERGGADKHLRRLRQTLARQQQRLLLAIGEHFPDGTRVTKPLGGYMLWVELPEHIDTLKLHGAALARGIVVAPGPIFTGDRQFRNCLRMNYGHPWSDGTEAAMEELARLMQDPSVRAS
ncbi:PLP-dependent aminotransferase family protein [Ramlibacter sp.]|uniref:aminotransferase-like domain-containing protein n=1 Tax=Ramlibacter sp. TaxID=1917967 RepID=UPI00260897A5|nr:PLP-dependent aminotransferase family protein [Ramlibacter sp.]MDB5956495.1 transcriptional regulator, GntR family with aminotransferase domain [Ramlibacter sp.]